MANSLKDCSPFFDVCVRGAYCEVISFRSIGLVRVCKNFKGIYRLELCFKIVRSSIVLKSIARF